MGTMTLSIPDELLQKMRQFREMKWSEVARQAIDQRIKDFETIDKIAQKSKLTQKDVEEFSEKIKKAAAKRFNEYCA